MYGEIITVGNELTSGKTLDLNARYAAGRLTALGIEVIRVTSVGDDTQMLTGALTNALHSSSFVIVTGGLGPTSDDITNEVVAKALERPLCLDSRMLERIKKYVTSIGLEMSPFLEKMAWMPEGSRVIHPNGKICGFSLVEQEARFYFLPGVPEQMRQLLDKFVIPEIQGLEMEFPLAQCKTLKVYGLTESQIAETLRSLDGGTQKVILGFYPSFPENHITLSVRGERKKSVSKELDRLGAQIERLLGSFIFARGEETMEAVVGRMLLEKGLTLSVAESCTGGLIGHRLTNVPGSSEYFQGGVVVYSNQAKKDLLGVREETLETSGAVSRSTAVEMAQGVRKVFLTHLGLAVTGIAGPGGGSEDKPVGTVHIALAADDKLSCQKYLFSGDRKEIKLNTTMMGLDWVRRYLNDDPFLSGI